MKHRKKLKPTKMETKMATPQTATAQKTVPAAVKANGAKKERNEGPLDLTFADKKGAKDHKRVPLDVASVIVTAKGGHGAKEYDTTKFPAEIKDAMIAGMFAGRVKTYVNNHAKKDGTNTLEFSDKIYADFMSGKIYSREGGGGRPAKPFDASLYVDALDKAFQFMASKKMKFKSGQLIKPFSAKELADARTKLESATKDERKAKISSWKDNPIYKRILAELEAKRIEMDTTEEVEEMAF